MQGSSGTRNQYASTTISTAPCDIPKEDEVARSNGASEEPPVEQEAKRMEIAAPTARETAKPVGKRAGEVVEIEEIEAKIQEAEETGEVVDLEERLEQIIEDGIPKEKLKTPVKRKSRREQKRRDVKARERDMFQNHEGEVEATMRNVAKRQEKKARKEGIVKTMAEHAKAEDEEFDMAKGNKEVLPQLQKSWQEGMSETEGRNVEEVGGSYAAGKQEERWKIRNQRENIENRRRVSDFKQEAANGLLPEAQETHPTPFLNQFKKSSAGSKRLQPHYNSELNNLRDFFAKEDAEFRAAEEKARPSQDGKEHEWRVEDIRGPEVPIPQEQAARMEPEDMFDDKWRDSESLDKPPDAEKKTPDRRSLNRNRLKRLGRPVFKRPEGYNRKRFIFYAQ